METREDGSIVCMLCNITLANEQSKGQHLLGKKHQLALHNENMHKLRESCGIYVTGFPNLAKHEEILELLSGYGKIVEHFFGDNNRFLIVQFDKSEPATELLAANLSFKGRQLHIKQRTVKGPTHTVPPSENYDDVIQSLKNAPDFDSQVTWLLQTIQPNYSEYIQKYKLLCADLQNILRNIFTNCIVHPFGSTVTGLAFKNSDVDIYVQVFNNNRSPSSSNVLEHSRATRCVNKSQKLLQRYKQVFSQVYAIPKAKTPIVKCIHNLTNISCDFNFKNMLGVCNSLLICYYLSINHPKLVPIMIIIKYWAKVHDLSGSSGRFSNYALTLLFIFYLQQEPYLFPTVLDLQTPRTVNIQEGWNGGFERKQYFCSALNSHSIPQILQGFFKFYSTFDYTLYIICPFRGKTMEKLMFMKSELLPEEFERYKRNVQEQVPLRMDTVICVQDPFELNHNVSTSVPQKILDEFVALCKLGADIFKDLPSDNLALYKLMNEESECFNLKSAVNYDSECVFKIPMSGKLLYLNNTVNSNVQLSLDEQILQIRSAWYELVNTFILKVLSKVMRFTIEVLKENPDSKSQKLEGQTDVHDTNVVDSFGCHCSGTHNFWQARNSVLKDLHIDDSVSVLEKQISVTDYIYNLQKNLNLNEVIIEFNMNIKAKVNPTEMVFCIKKIKAKKGYFKSFAGYFVKFVPTMFEKYITELDKSIKEENNAENDQEIEQNKEDA